MRNLEIRVLTPAFYSRLTHYTYTSEAIDRECVFTDERNRTLWMCRPQLLPLLLSEKDSLQVEDMSQRRRGYLDELRWQLLRKLRCSPADPAYSQAAQSSAFDITDVRARPYSELDRFVRSSKGEAHAGDYRRAVTKIFLAQRFCFGFSEVIGAIDLLLRVLLCCFGAIRLGYWSTSLESTGSTTSLRGRMTQSRWESSMTDSSNSWWLSESVSILLSCHIYQMAKGYR